MLEDVLEPNETIIFREEIPVEEYQEMAMTNKRIILYRRTGLIFKKDDVSSIPLKSISNVKFHEKGVIRKKGELTMEIGKEEPLTLEGNLSEIKYVYNKILSNL